MCLLAALLAVAGCAPSAEREGAAPDTAAEEEVRPRETPGGDAPGAPTGEDAGRRDTGRAAEARPGLRRPPAACDTVGEQGEEDGMGETTDSGPSIHEVLERHRDGWMARDDVVGTGIGRCDDAPCLVIYLRELTEAVEAELPACVEGYAVRLEETGTVRPRDGPGGASAG